MKVYDISQEILSCEVYPGDPIPSLKPLERMSEGSLYNLSAVYMCVHNGTHCDAPSHFKADGKTIDQLSPESFVGNTYVASCEGNVSGEDAKRILENAKRNHDDSYRRILIKGDAEVTEAAAEVFAGSGIVLLGNESQSVGPLKNPVEVHKILLEKEVVLLEGIRLKDVPEGFYILCAAPLNIQGAEGSPCRAVLISK
ncbi:MAG: cyclase family protein [Erysipelotrichaceae bacterium]|nr:cyclase family protein [Erysipelotrichaceae bacterium]